MKDLIYVVNLATREAVHVEPTTFSELEVKERKDLQSWLMQRPEVLGEPLLVISSEFDRFDKSGRRLDLLMLDRDASLVIVELKLDIGGTLADQQAIRYAAFCSTMRMEDVVDNLARRLETSSDDAALQICSFLGVEELPELYGEPRIILAAGRFADQELTATVMWLRRFGIDISCIELTPYRYPNDPKNVLLVPKTLIPLPEAEEYQISVERKERSRIARRAKGGSEEFLRQILEEYAKLDPQVEGPKKAAKGNWQPFSIGHGQVHYEWMVRRLQKRIDVAIHFEANDRELNRRRLAEVMASCPSLAESFEFETDHGDWGRNWVHFIVKIPFAGNLPGQEDARTAALIMKDLIERTIQAVQNLSQ